MKWKFIITSGLMLFGITSKVFSQGIELDPVTISSSLNPLQVSKTGRNIISIPGEQFGKLPVHSIDELLRYVPGVEVQQRGASGSQSDIVLRGGTFQQVLIILDGIRLNDPNTGHFNCYIPIAPSEIERIEILKGAASAIYGSEAVGGVIHIITKTFAARRNQTRQELAIEGTVGEYSLLNANAGEFYQNEQTAIAAGLITTNSNGQPQRGTTGFYHNSTGSLSLKQFIGSDWQIAFRSSFDVRDFGAQNFYTTFLSDTAREKVNSLWNQFQAKYQKNRHAVSIDAGYKDVKDHFAYNPSAIANKNQSRLFQTSVSDNIHLGAGSHLVAGTQYQRKWIRSNDRGNHSLDQVAGFVILNQSINKFSFSPALRLDYNSSGGTELVPQINLSYKFSHLQLRGSAGKTIRDADFTERYNNYNKTFVSGGSIGNPDLKAERSFSYEAGADYFVGQDLKISASYFQRRQKNVIDWTPTPYAQMPRKTNLSPNGNYALATNVANVTTTGVEADIQYSKTLTQNQSIWATLGLVWLNSKSSNVVPSFYISSHAKYLANFNVLYTNKIFSICVNGVYKNRTAQKATAINAEVDANCFMLNTKVDVFLLKDKLSLFWEVDNMTNQKCGDLLGAQVPGSWAMGGVKLKLNK